MEPDLQLLQERAENLLRQLDGNPESDSLLDSCLADLKAATGRTSDAGERLGPLIGQLQRAIKARAKSETVTWVSVGGGHLAIGHRPKIKAVTSLRSAGATHILTLLSDGEGASAIGRAVRQEHLGWLWFPVETAEPLPRERLEDVRRLYLDVQVLLANAGKVFVHCSAGIHRTGMIVYGLLRNMGMSAPQGKELLHRLRPETGLGVGEQRLAWGDLFSITADG